MVMKKALLILSLAGCLLFPVTAADISANMNFSTGSVFLNGTTRWTTSALARVSLASTGSSAVRGVLSASYGVNNSGYPVGFSLEKAYVRFRLPWFGDSTMRLTVGKSPVSWGYGTYFNAGDIVFGASPNDAAAGVLSGEYRTSAAWMILASLPLYDTFSADLIVLPDLESVRTGIVEGRVGGRFLWNPGFVPLDALEFGYLGTVDGSAHSVYAAFDGTLWFDYNLSLSTIIEPSDAADTAKENLRMSLGLFKMFNIPTDTRYVPLSFRIEGLYAPFVCSFSGFFSMDIGVSDSVGVGAVFLCDMPAKAIVMGTPVDVDCTLSAVLTCSYRPVAGLVLGLQGGVASSVKDSDWDFAGTLMFSCQYSF